MSNADNIRGHKCEGLKEFQDSSTYSCIPCYDEEGCMMGCDDTNYVLPSYCPFCGEKLPDVSLNKNIE